MSNFLELLSQTETEEEYNGLYQMIIMAIILRQQIKLKEKNNEI